MMFKHARINQQNNHKTLYCHVGTIIIATRRKVGDSLYNNGKKISFQATGCFARMPDDPLMHLHNYDTISPFFFLNSNGGRIINFYSKAITVGHIQVKPREMIFCPKNHLCFLTQRGDQGTKTNFCLGLKKSKVQWTMEVPVWFL